MSLWDCVRLCETVKHTKSTTQTTKRTTPFIPRGGPDTCCHGFCHRCNGSAGNRQEKNDRLWKRTQGHTGRYVHRNVHMEMTFFQLSRVVFKNSSETSNLHWNLKENSEIYTMVCTTDLKAMQVKSCNLGVQRFSRFQCISDRMHTL